MSRIGNALISIPSGVTVTVKDNVVTVKGAKGELTQEIKPSITVKVEDGAIKLSRASESKQDKSYHGLFRSLLNNMVIGVSQGYKKELELVGVGFRATSKGQLLELALGYSHPIHLMLPTEIKVEAVTDRKSNPIITLESIDKQLIGQVCAKIRSLRKVEPYKGKGVRFKGEEVRRKAGNSAKV
jgi:large subunit ribosomal protein L6